MITQKPIRGISPNRNKFSDLRIVWGGSEDCPQFRELGLRVSGLGV